MKLVNKVRKETLGHLKQEHADEYMKSEAARVRFEGEVAQWAIGLQQYTADKHRYEPIAAAENQFNRDGDYEGTTWSVPIGNIIIVISARHESEYRIPHIRVSAKIRESSIFFSEGEVKLFSREKLDQDLEFANLLIGTFPGHSVAEWWHKERNEYARWIASRQPEWESGNPAIWPPASNG